MIKKLFVCLGVCLVFTLGSALHDQTGDSLLWEEEAMAASRLLEHQIPPMGPLEEKIEGLIAGKSGQWSVYLKNLETEEELVYNSVQMQPASVIKLFRMVALYQAAQRSELELTEELLELAEKMITVSDNAASNEIVAALGQGSFEAGAERVTQTAQELGCTQTQDGMMLFDYDPGFLVPGQNLTTVQDCGIILEQIYRKECVSPQYDQEMLYLLLGQTRRWKIPALLPGGARVANKTGETDDIQADVGIVFSPKCDYVICVIVNQTLDGLESQQTIAELSQLVYSYLND
ncbi:MAG: serine hydrolase [Clostridia bacterium]|nr:serine hydrolase [Clostridia bacterium]